MLFRSHGDSPIVDDTEMRHDFIEELCDVMMYFNDVMLCYNITPEELREIYLDKHNKNMKRW